MTDLERGQDAAYTLCLVKKGEPVPQPMLDTLTGLFRDCRTATQQEAAQRVEKVLEKHRINAPQRKEITDAIWGKEK